MKSSRTRWVWIVLVFAGVLVVGLAAGYRHRPAHEVIFGFHDGRDRTWTANRDRPDRRQRPSDEPGRRMVLGTVVLPTSELGRSTPTRGQDLCGTDRRQRHCLVLRELFDAGRIVAPHRKPATCDDGRTTSATAGATAP